MLGLTKARERQENQVARFGIMIQIGTQDAPYKRLFRLHHITRPFGTVCLIKTRPVNRPSAPAGRGRVRR
jgi:hypothetical protein